VEDPLSGYYRTHGGRVYRYCLFRTGSREDAEDLTAETFVRLMRSRHPSGEETLPWLLRVAHNLCTDHSRKAGRSQRPLPRAEDAVEVEWPDPAVHDALASLPDARRQAVWLKAVEDLTFEQTAWLMRKRVGAVKMLYYRGIRQLRERMEAEGDGPHA
jgi:RNA polymerase sigma-70 factor, ECF subfamily